VRRFLTWLIGLPTAILLVGFAVANRTWVDVSLDPFDRSNPSVYLHMPLWSVLVLGVPGSIRDAGDVMRARCATTMSG
jgi:hypothetical protein